MILHMAVALVIVFGIGWSYWMAIPSFFAIGYFFEKTQHRYYWSAILTEDGEPKLIREKEGWFGWVTKHRLLEAAGWGFGSILGCGLIWASLRWQWFG